MTPTPDDAEAWDGAQLLRYFDHVARDDASSDPARRAAATPYHAAAAVLAAFDPGKIRGVGGAAAPPPEEDLRRLLSDSVALPDASAGARWSLQVERRREALASFGLRQELREALELNARPADDVVQRLIDGCILGPAPDLDDFDEEGLRLTSEVVGWLTGVPALEPLELPDLDEIRRRLEFLRLATPLRRLAGAHFHGRAAELAQVRNHIDGPPGAPLMIWGLGGVGKSTLIARAALDLIEGRGSDGPAPVVYLDFDRKTLPMDRPAALLLEAVRQVAAQLPPGDVSALSTAVFLSNALSEDLADRTYPDRALLAGTTGMERLSSFDDLLRNVQSWARRPLLVALDTFEDVQYRSRQTVELLLRFFGRWQDEVPSTRVVIAGRTRLQDRSGPEIVLTGLDEDSAVGCLIDLGVPPDSARFIHGKVGGSPLALHLAAEVVRRESAGGLTEGLKDADFALRLDEAMVNGWLFRRIIDHIRNPRVRRLAHPGLVLRYITPSLIQQVLAGPCLVDVPDEAAARKLWEALARETSLVVVDGGERLQHRPDLRREMIDLLRASRRGQAAAIHEAAVDYFAQAYETSRDPADRAEELYHRLCLEQPATEIDPRWSPEAEEYLRESVDELPEKGMAYLAAQGGTSSSEILEAVVVSDYFWERAEESVWERKTAQWVQDLIRQDRYEDALASLRERSGRSPTSPLWLLEARVLRNLGQLREAAEVLHAALEQTYLFSYPGQRLDLFLQLLRVDEMLGLYESARAALAEAQALAPRGATLAQKVDLDAAGARIGWDESVRQAARDRLGETLAGLSDRQLSTIPSEARRGAAELVITRPEVVARVLGLVGLGQSTPSSESESGSPLSALVQLVAEDTDPASVHVRVAQALAVAPGLAASLGEFLRRSQEATARRSASSEAEYAQARSRDLERGIYLALVDAFSGADLRQFILEELDVRILKSISFNRAHVEAVFEVVQWFVRHGRLEELVRAAARARPENREIRALLENIGVERREEFLESPRVQLRSTQAGGKGPEKPTRGYVRLREKHLEQFVAVLVETYRDVDELRTMIRFRTERIVPPSAESTSGLLPFARLMVERANAEGWVGQLIAAATEARPGSASLYHFAEDYGLTAVRPEDDRRIREALPMLDVGAWRSRLGELEGRVCRIKVAGGSMGTGLLVGPDLVLTVRHLIEAVLQGRKPIADVSIVFDEKQLENGEVWNAGLQLRPAARPRAAAGPPLPDVFAESEALDYVVVRLDGAPGRRPVGWPRCEASAASRGWFLWDVDVPPPAAGAPLILLSYSGAGPLRLAFESRAMLSAGPAQLRYRGLTGSSGAPVLDMEGRLLALHQARASAPDGAGPGPTEGAESEYAGVRGVAVGAIFADLVERRLDPLSVPATESQGPVSRDVSTIILPTFDSEETTMPPLPGDVPFVSRSPFESADDGLESVGPESAGPPPKPPAGAAPSEAQKARANDLFLRGALTPEQLAEAKASRGGFELVIGKSNFLPAVFLETGAVTSRATCQIRTSGIDYLGRSGSWMGTAFLISPNVLVTNHHVLNSPDVAAAGVCVFDYQVGVDGRPRAPRTFQIKPDRLFLTSPIGTGLDYTFVWVDGDPGREFGVVRIDRQAFAIAEEEFANIVSHPKGRMKEISVQQNEVQWQDGLVVHYTSDTEPGSSGAPVCNNAWRLVALHHASKDSIVPGFRVLNEGIKLSAIAADLERISRSSLASAAAASRVLELFQGTDERLGFFGTLGRPEAAGSGLEAVVSTFEGTEKDVDVGFWNVEWLTNNYATKAAAVADVVYKMNLDVWCLEESSPNAAARVAEELQSSYGLSYGWAAAEPDSADGKQSCTLLWNKEAVEVQPEPWGDVIEAWLQARSTDFDDLGLGGFEAVHGKIFDRYPALFKVTAKKPVGDSTFEFHLVPVHLKAMAEGSLRRKMASKILAEAIKKKIEDGASADWVVGGDFNAPLDTGDFQNLIDDGMVSISAADAEAGAFSYVKGPKSLIDHVFLSPNLAARAGSGDFFIVAAEKTIPDYIERVSDHRPVLVRLSLDVGPPAGGLEGAADSGEAALAELRARLGADVGAGGPEARRRRPRPRPAPRPGRGGGAGRPSGVEGREGYSAAFLGGPDPVPLPGLGALEPKAVEVDRRATGIDRYVLRYTHFSVVMNGERRMPFYSAVNIDGTQLRRIPRSEGWHLDARIPAGVQSGDEVYRSNDLDRGHMTRRLDPVWGTPGVASQADADTFCFTNACPQHKDLNQKEWLKLEDYILGNADAHNLRACVFTGPVLRPTDRPYRSVLLPEEFWKVAVILREDTGALSATGYMLSQRDMISGLEFVFGAFKTYQVTVRSIADLTGLDFGSLPDFDPMARLRRRPGSAGGLEATAGADVAEVNGPEDLVF